MSTQRERFITGADSVGGNPSQLEVGARHANSFLTEEAEGLLMTFHAKQNLDNVAGRLSNVYGPAVNKLWANRHAQLPLKVMSERDQPPCSWRGPVLMVYPNARMLGRVAEIRDVTAEVVVPWTTEREDIRDWILAWTPAPLGAAVPSLAGGPDLSPVTKEALRCLTSFVNVNNALVTSSDTEEAIHTFETLLAFDSEFDAGAVRARLVGHEGWPAEMADRALKIIDDLRADKRIRGRLGPDRRRYELWCERASETAERDAQRHGALDELAKHAQELDMGY
jgi:hypothetical protein